jgi:hypothetical protein
MKVYHTLRPRHVNHGALEGSYVTTCSLQTTQFFFIFLYFCLQKERPSYTEKYQQTSTENKKGKGSKDDVKWACTLFH